MDTLLRVAFHLVDFLHHLEAHVVEGLGEHLCRLVLLACHRIQANQHLADGHRYIE